MSETARVVANFGASLAVRREPAAGDGRAEGAFGPDGGGSGREGGAAEADGAGEGFEQAVPLRRLPLVVAGDLVRLARDARGTLRAAALLPRASVLERADARGRPRPLAANLSHLGIVTAAPPGIDTRLVDELAVAAHDGGIEPLVIVNKGDLLAGEAREAAERALAVYRDVGYPAVLVDTVSAAGLAPLRDELEGRRVALVGASGVGKSSIVARLLPDREVRVGAVSEASGHGAHTTSVTFLYELPGGGAIVDSPGVRRYSVAHLAPAALRAGYPEIARHASRCRFGDCAHVAEPGCAVREALGAGRIAPWRYANYRALAER